MFEIPIISETNEALVQKARALCNYYGFKWSEKMATQPICLILEKERLSVRLTIDDHEYTFYVDFGNHDYRQSLKTVGKKSPLARAIGISKKPDLKVIDATAGFAKDALIMAKLGAEVTLLEKAAPVHALVRDAFERFAPLPEYQDIISRCTLHYTNSIEFIEKLTDDNKPDVIYLDPMFPERNKSAKVRKNMQVLQYIATKSEDESLLLARARQKATYRVVVKRPKTAGFIANEKPNFSITSPSMRFDIYQS